MDGELHRTATPVAGEVSRPSAKQRFEALYRANREPLLAYFLRRVENPHDAADLLAQVFLIAWQRRDSLPPYEQQRLWLYGTARNLLLNHRRRRNRDQSLAVHLGNALVMRGGFVTGDVSGLAQDVRAVLGRLSDQDRELLMLSGWDGLSPAEIAAVLERPAATVRVALHRARARLTALLNETELSHSTGV